MSARATKQQKNQRRDIKPMASRLAFALSFFALVFAFAVAPTARARADQWSSVRANGMGGAYTAVVTDSDSLFYNPAGLARNSAFAWTVFDPRGGLSNPTALTDVQSIISGGNGNLATNLGRLYGKNIWAGGGAKSAIVLPYVGFSAFAGGEAQFGMHNPAASTLNVNYFFDYGFALGAGFSLVPGFWHMGIVAKRVNRTGTFLPIGAATLATLDTATLENELRSRGTGYGLDYGTVITVPGPVSPTFSLVYRDIGYTTFNHEEGAHAPTRTEPEVVIGGALKISALLLTITPSFDFRYAQRADMQTGKKVHLGLELGLPLIDLRAGLNQGYYTLGAGMNLGILRVDVATYGVELGVFPGQMEDRRYVAQVTFELGFDPGDFGFGGRSGSGPNGSGGSGGGGRSRLKQRR